MICVVVGDEDVCDGDPEPLDRVEQRLVDAVRVDEDAVPALPVGDEVGVGEPARVLGALDDQGSSSQSQCRQNSITVRMPS